MDDEKYFTFFGHNMPGNARYCSNDKSTCPVNVCFAGNEKFTTKVYHKDLNYMFWSDLASAHYSAATVGWMDQNINYVSKHINSPNVSQVRPIENFWGWLSQKVYEGDR